MERLTEKQSAGYDLKALNGQYCNHYCDEQSDATCRDCAIYQAVQKLANYENLEEQGKLLILPCKPGDTVYLLAKDAPKPQIIPHKVKNLIYCVEIIPKIGKTVFLTELEAKEAMEKKESN